MIIVSEKIKQSVITLTYQFKMRLTCQQTQEIENILAVCRRVYNFGLAERKAWLKSRKSPVNACSIISEYIIPVDTPYPNYFVQAKALTIAKQSGISQYCINIKNK